MSGTAFPWVQRCVGQALRRVEHDLDQGTLQLSLPTGHVTCRGVHASNLLGPWDGMRGRVAELTVTRRDGLCFLEWRIEYPEVPRHYRVVCREVAWTGQDPPLSP